jgi:2-polyprenyl-3-methyl-5-hydroxy-6-metoxy-1,4-benzoquinol methylase
MSLGSFIRRMAGPLEPALANGYRSFFFDIDAFADSIADLGCGSRVVEIGCGEGALISALATRMPDATFLGLDVAPTVGRLFKGDSSRTAFICADAEEVVEVEGGRADLVLICDVMHHVPPGDRDRVWAAALQLVKPEGTIVFKEWIRSASPIYGLGYFSDRFVTGDRIQYQSRKEWAKAIAEVAPLWRIASELSLRPWKSNHAFVLKQAAAEEA